MPEQLKAKLKIQDFSVTSVWLLTRQLVTSWLLTLRTSTYVAGKMPFFLGSLGRVCLLNSVVALEEFEEKVTNIFLSDGLWHERDITSGKGRPAPVS